MLRGGTSIQREVIERLYQQPLVEIDFDLSKRGTQRLVLTFEQGRIIIQAIGVSFEPAPAPRGEVQ